MLKSIGVIGVSAVFLFLGWTVPVNARQGHGGDTKGQDRPQRQDKPAEKQQQGGKPARQDQPQANKQQNQQRPQQQAKAPQQQQKPQQQAKRQPQQPNNSDRQQQQAKGQQEQQHQQTRQQGKTVNQPQQQAMGQQQQRQTQGASSQRPQRTQQAMAAQRAQPSLRLSARGSGRIPDARFHANFGHEHAFHMGNPVMVGGYSRFQYGGYWFGFVQPWPVGWYYTDDVYIDYVDGGYYMYDPYYPGVRFAISVVL